MDSVFGLVGDGYGGCINYYRCAHLKFFEFNFFLVTPIRFSILASDASAARSILVFKHDQDKVCSL